LGNGWYYIIFDAFLDKRDVDKDFPAKFEPDSNFDYLCDMKLKAGTPLYDKDGNTIGKALHNQKIWSIYHSKITNQHNLLAFEITGCTHINNFQPSSMIENKLADKINSLQSPILKSSMDGFLSENIFYPWRSKNDFDSYEYEFASDGLVPGFERLVVVFYKNELVAVLFVEQSSLRFIKVKIINASYKLGYLKTLDKSVEKELENTLFKQASD
jgi:hypothetical protein